MNILAETIKIESAPKKQEFHCSECDASFINITSWNNHQCDNNTSDDSDSDSESDSDSSSSDDDMDLDGAANSKSKRNTANSKPKQKRLSLNDAIQNSETMDNWSATRRRAFNNRLTNQNEFYYRFSAKEISANDNEQRALLMITNRNIFR